VAHIAPGGWDQTCPLADRSNTGSCTGAHQNAPGRGSSGQSVSVWPSTAPANHCRPRAPTGHVTCRLDHEEDDGIIEPEQIDTPSLTSRFVRRRDRFWPQVL